MKTANDLGHAEQIAAPGEYIVTRPNRNANPDWGVVTPEQWDKMASAPWNGWVYWCEQREPAKMGALSGGTNDPIRRPRIPVTPD